MRVVNTQELSAVTGGEKELSSLQMEETAGEAECPVPSHRKAPDSIATK
jgi:hypothetical protein